MLPRHVKQFLQVWKTGLELCLCQVIQHSGHVTMNKQFFLFLSRNDQEFYILLKEKTQKLLFLYSGIPVNQYALRRKDKSFPYRINTFSQQQISLVITDNKTQLPHGQVNQGSLDNSWANFHVFISTICFLKLLLLSLMEKENL